MQFKFSPDKLNYSSWRRLRQKTKQSSQSVSQQEPQEPPQNTLEKDKPCLAAPQVYVLFFASTTARRAQDLVPVLTATSYLLFSKAEEDPGQAH